MKHRIEDLEARVEFLARQVADLSARTSALEAKGPPGQPASAGATDAVSHAPVAGAPSTGAVALVSLIGRTLVVLGGAYLLRAITDASLVPRAQGVAAGLAYAAWWLVRSDREAAAGRRPSASFHGLAAAMIAFPLIAETTARFGLLPAPASATAVLAFLALGLAVALRRNLATVGVISTLFALATALVLLVATQNLMPYALTLLLIAVAVEVLALNDRWLGLRWPAALALDLGVLSVAVVVSRPGGLPDGYSPVSALAALAIQVALALLYASSVAARTVVRRHSLTAFEGVQTSLALLLGLTGAHRLAGPAALPPAAALLSLLLAVAGYAAAFCVLESRGRRSAAFHFLATLAGVLSLTGASLLLSGGSLAISLLGFGVAALALGSRSNRPLLVFHGVSYLAAAAWVAGLAGSTVDALLTPAGGPWRGQGGVGSLVLLAAALGYGLLLTGRPPTAAWWGRLPRAVVAALLGCGTLGGVTRALVHAFALGPGAQAAAVATVRTALLALLAVLLAWAGRRFRLRELTWLAYPVLVGGGLKLLFEDLPHGRPASLFLSLTLYGGALLATPRLLRRET